MPAMKSVNEPHLVERQDKPQLTRRLNRIEGQIRGIGRMVEEDRYCVDILRQTFAVRRALQKLESQLIDGHLRTCVVDGVKEGREEQVLTELVELYEIADR